MNNKISDLLFYAVIGIIIVSLLYGLNVTTSKLSAQREELRTTKRALDIANDEIQLRVRNGSVVGSVNTVEGNLALIRLTLDTRLEQLESKFGPLKNIQTYVNTGIKTAGVIYTNVKDSIVYKDSIKYTSKVFTYSDNYLQLNCVYLGDSVKCPYSYSDSLEIVIKLQQNWKWYEFKKRSELKKKGFDKYSPVTEVSSRNPLSKPVFIESFKIQQK